MKALQIKFKNADSIAEFERVIRKYPFEAALKCGAYTVDAKSVLGIFSIAAPDRALNLEIHADECSELISDLESFYA